MIPVDLGTLSPAEQQLWDAYPRGTQAKLPEESSVRAEVVRSLLLGAREAEPGHRAALRVHGTTVTGLLDLYQSDVDVAVEFVNCVFDTVPLFWFARMRGVSFEGSTLPGLEAFGATVQGTLNFVKCTFTGALVIYGAQVSGDLDLDWARVAADAREADARTVLLAKQRRRRPQLPWAGRVWGLLQDGLVGYGYRPVWATLWLLALTAIGTVAFTLSPPGLGSAGTTYHPLVYTLDVLIPIIDFGQQKVFGIGGAAQWLAYLFTAIGWVLFTAVAAAMTRTFNRS